MLPIMRFNGQNWLPNVLNDFFDTDWTVRGTAATPSVNVIEDGKNYKVEVAAPGISKEDADVHVNKDGQLVVKVEKKSGHEEKGADGKRYLRREFSYTKFEQAFLIPENVDKEKISASVANGILSINLPKQDPEVKVQENRRIEIQ